MEIREELLLEVLKRVQRNYVRIVEIERITKELGDALSRNDQESAQLLVEMRQDEMDHISEMKQEIRMLVESSEPEEKKLLISWIAGENKYQPDSFEAKKLLELSSQLQQVLNRTITIDKAINKKLAGKDSFYHTAS